jgi:protein-tyrosine kinase
MSRIFDAVTRGTDEVADTILAALGDMPPDRVEPEADVQALLGAALQNLPAPDKLTPADSARHSLDAVAACQPVLAKEIHPKPISLNRSAVRTVALKVTAHSPLLPFDTTNWRASEQYRTVRTRILQDARQPRMIAISSAGAGDGKTVTAINIAGALSLKAEADVVLVDADFRRSSVHTQLCMPATPGITDILLGHCAAEEAIVRAEQFPNLYILPAGKRVENPSDLLEARAWETLRDHLAACFRFIIFDCPPIGAVSEYDLLQAACDGVVVVGRQDHTRLEDFLDAVKSIPSEKLMGVVLNCVSDWFLSRPYNAYEYPRPK